MKDIEPMSGVGRECMEDILITIMHNKRDNYELAFGTTWSFDYQITKEPVLLGDKLTVNWGKIEDNAQKYLGLKI